MILRLGKRIATFVVTMWVASVLIFGLMAVVPGDPAQVALGVNATPEALAQTREEFGTDKPLVQQYATWFSGVARGDFGTSYITRAEIGPQIAERAQVTMWLVVLSLILSVLVAIPIGVLAAVRRRHFTGTLLVAGSVIGIAVPSFVLAIVLVTIFAVKLGVLPSGGWTVPTEGLVPFLKSICMPIVTLGLVQAALLSRYVRSATLEVLNQDYMRTARAKGLTRGRAFLRHGLRNMLVPVLTVLGLMVAALLVDTIIVEKVFVIPGLGDLLLTGATNRDQLLVQGIVMLIVAVILTVNLIVDLLYVCVDPRLRKAT
ncbi:ABC transporter permease [Nocardioides sp. LHG3406-4]|uniref:ABC transporter permease n=1 Tax=Nocardioides sp. LHG3406-4 TaxID=2804575 RepID=UPI003CE881F0